MCSGLVTHLQRGMLLRARALVVSYSDPLAELAHCSPAPAPQIGADVIELGVPYSDPLADGATIQAAATRALQQGTTMDKVCAGLLGLQLPAAASRAPRLTRCAVRVAQAWCCCDRCVLQCLVASAV